MERMVVHWQDRARDCSPQVWAQGFQAPIEGQWWYDALEAGGLEDQFRFLYAEVLDAGGRVLAIAPAFLMDMPLEMFVPEPLLPVIRPLGRVFPALLHQRTLFFGSPCGDRGWIGFADDCPVQERGRVVQALNAALASKAAELGAPMRVWKDFPESFRPWLDPLCSWRGLFRVVSFPGTLAVLPPAGLPAYFAALKPSWRQKLRRNLRRSHDGVEIRCEIVGQPDEATLDALFALFWQTYERATTRFERLNRRFLGALAAAAPVRCIVLRSAPHDTPVAFMLVYVDGPVLVNKFIGIDYRCPREWRLYYRLWEAALELAVQLGCTGIESGQTGYAVKWHIGHRPIPLWNWCQHRNPLMRAIQAAVARRISWASLDPELAEVDGPEAELREGDAGDMP